MLSAFLVEEQEVRQMFHNVKRDYNKTLRQQIKEGTSQGWEYIGVFGRGDNAILKFIEKVGDQNEIRILHKTF